MWWHATCNPGEQDHYTLACLNSFCELQDAVYGFGAWLQQIAGQCIQYFLIGTEAGKKVIATF